MAQSGLIARQQAPDCELDAEDRNPMERVDARRAVDEEPACRADRRNSAAAHDGLGNDEAADDEEQVDSEWPKARDVVGQELGEIAVAVPYAAQRQVQQEYEERRDAAQFLDAVDHGSRIGGEGPS
jgi:hypothetical protein